MLVWWIGAVAIAFVAAAVFVFNDLIAARNQVRAAWSDIDVQLTRRHDLVPQLVAAVQGYASYERATLTTVTELRTRAVAAASLADKAEVEGELGKQIDRILALQERYPDLKASDSAGPRGIDFLSSHPATPERVKNAIANARQFSGPGRGERDHTDYLAALDGLVYGEDPSEGFARGRHPPALRSTIPRRRCSASMTGVMKPCAWMW